MRRLLPLGGIVYVVLALAGPVAFAQSTPETSDPGSKVVAFYHAHSTRQGVAAFVLAASVPFLVAFAASLATRLWPTDGYRRPVWELILLAGAAMTGAAIAATAWIHFALADAGDNRIGVAGVQALNELDNTFWVAVNPSLGVMLLGAAGAILASQWGRRWIGWAALVLGVALFIPAADFVALLLSFLWVIVVAIMLYRDGSHAELERHTDIAASSSSEYRQ
jgi:hypothetical protein